MRFIEQLKKILVLTVAVSSISLVGAYHSKAEAGTMSENLLAQIADNTYRTLQALQNIPTYLYNFAQLAQSWLAQDTAGDSFISQSQANFNTLGRLFSSDGAAIDSMLQRTMFADLVGADIGDFEGRKPTILRDVPNINDLAYSSLVGNPPVPAGRTTPFYGFVKFASGLNYPHQYPQKSWEGTSENLEIYKRYFETITAIQSYNNHVIAQLNTKNFSTPVQNQLVTQASSPSWLAQIATEELGKVLRHILLFESQSYILNTKIQETQMQLVTAQAMTNSLLILFNRPMEDQLFKSAQGTAASALE